MVMPAGAVGERPGALTHELRQQRAVTKGRFGTKTTSELDLFLQDQRIRREQFPEIAARVREEEATVPPFPNPHPDPAQMCAHKPRALSPFPTDPTPPATFALYPGNTGASEDR